MKKEIIKDYMTDEMREEEQRLWNELVKSRIEKDRIIEEKEEEKKRIREINNNFMRIIR
jgi:hypothetical protein